MPNDEPGAAPQRMQFEFTGTTTKTVSLDPAEFAGLSVTRVTEQIIKVMASIAPDINFFNQEIIEAANEVASAASK